MTGFLDLFEKLQGTSSDRLAFLQTRSRILQLLSTQHKLLNTTNWNLKVTNCQNYIIAYVSHIILVFTEFSQMKCTGSQCWTRQVYLQIEFKWFWVETFAKFRFIKLKLVFSLTVYLGNSQFCVWWQMNVFCDNHFWTYEVECPGK